MPPNMADWLPPDHLVWFLIEVVDQLDTSAFHRLSRRGGAGRAGYDPDMLLTLLLYAYAVGERSSRRIERLCIDHVAFRIACGDDGPDHTTIARFRAEHCEAFKDLFAQVLRLCAAAGMVKVGNVAIDGTKIAANAARGANRSPKRVRDEARRLAAQMVDQAAVTDATEDHLEATRGGSDDDLPPGFADSSRRAANIAKALAELDAQDAAEAEQDAQDAREIEEFLVGVEAGTIVGQAPPPGTDLVRYHRARIARCERILAELEGRRGAGIGPKRNDARKVLAAAQASLAAAERAAAEGGLDRRGRAARKRGRREAKARARGGTGRIVNVTDPDSRLMTEGSGGGSVQGYNAQFAVSDDHLILGMHVSQDANDTHCYAPTLAAATKNTQRLGLDIGVVLADAGYFTEANLTTPGPDRLIAPGKNREVAADAHDRPTTGPPPEGADPAEQMRHRLRDPVNAALYKRRSATIEPVNGHIKDQVGLRRFAQRGLHAVTAELHLAAAVINLNRLHRTAPATG